MVMNGVGAAGTGLVAVLILATKFLAGAWMVLVAVPVIVAGLSRLRPHYDRTRRRLRPGSPDPTAISTVTVLLPPGDIDDAAACALAFVRGLRGPGVRVELTALPPTAAELSHGTSGLLNVVIPEVFEARSLRSALRRTSQFAVAARLHDEPGVVVTHVPALAGSAPLPPRRADDHHRGAGVRAPLEIVDAPFRSLERPVLETVRAATARPGTIVAVVVPELATGRWWQDLLHNERSLYLGWLPRSEPRVVLSGVPLRRTI
jgi:hypothetical protein